VAVRQRLDVAAIHAKALEVHESLSGVTLQPKHAALYFENVVKKESTAQQQSGKCMACDATVVSTGAFKFQTHIINCVLMPAVVKRGFQQLRVATEGKARGKREAALVQQEEVQIAAIQHDAEQKQLKQLCIRAGVHEAETDAADKAIANFFYANAIPFSVATSEPGSLYRQMVTAIQKAPPSYVPPTASKLGNELLDRCEADMWAKLKARDKDGQQALKFGSSYVSDGWDSCDSLPLINSAFITANDGGVFWRSVDTTGKTKSAEYCAALMIGDIYAYGPHKVVMIVTDTCSTMQKCWQLVEEEFPWISTLPCQPHVISLLMKDIGKTKEVSKLISDESIVVQWFQHHHFPLALLRRVVKEKLGKAKELIRAGGTRFGTNTLVGERLVELKPSLQATVVNEEYVAQNYKDKGSTEEETAAGKLVRSNKGATTKALVLDGAGFWSQVKTHVETTKPIFKMLRRFDTGSPTIGKLYSSWFELGEHLHSVPSSYRNLALEKHAERWAYGHAAIAAAAYVLDPEFHGHEQETNGEVMEGFIETLEKIATLVVVRQMVAASDDLEKQWKERAKLIAADPSKLKSFTHYPTYPTTSDQGVQEFCSKANAQLALYRGRKGIFAREWIFKSAEQSPAYMWWDSNGASVPELQTAARLILSQPSSSSICERINGEFAFVKDPRRNRLGHQKASKLVSLFHNLRLLSRMNKPTYTEPAIGWNDEDNKVGLVKFGVADYAAPKHVKINPPERPQLTFEPEQEPFMALMEPAEPAEQEMLRLM